MLPCKLAKSEVATSVAVTNTTSQALPANKVVYYNLQNTTDYFKTSQQTPAGSQATFPLPPSAPYATSCTAWVMQ